ncbi:MAG: dodecin domain-containing protein [Bacteroidetes bacterium]|nr:MAG: dodecin domain-containing protein [Bacteroidota bacterium]
MSVMKVIEIMASSDKSWEDAAKKGLKKAAQSVKNIRSAWVQDQSVTVDKDGEVKEFRVTLKVTFEVQ